MLVTLADVVSVRTAPIFREKAPEPDDDGNVQALAIRDILGHWPPHNLPRIQVDDSLLPHCLSPGEVVIPARGDYYIARYLQNLETNIFPLGQINIISPSKEIDGVYLAWYLNQPEAQKRIAGLLTGTSIQSLSRKNLLGLQVFLPTLATQYAVAKLLTMWEENKMLRERILKLQEDEIQATCHMLLHDASQE
jgi:hypothetical protein